MSMSLEAAAQAMREAMRETVKHSVWYLVQGILMVLGGIWGEATVWNSNLNV
jgi:hypothetical protein